MYSESDARKTRSLSICLIMVLSALGPVVSADYGYGHMEMNSTLYVDGTEHEMVGIPFWGDLECTEVVDPDGNVEGYECSQDVDGDGVEDDFWFFEDCDDSSGSWECVWNYVDPMYGEGNHSLTVDVFNLETEVDVNLYADIWTYDDMGGMDYWYFDGTMNTTTAGEVSFSEAYMITDNSTCHGQISVHGDYDGNGTSIGGMNWNFAGPCEYDGHLELEYDGMLWEQVGITESEGIDNCDEIEGNWYCEIDYDEDGNVDWLNSYEDCEEDPVTGWECVFEYLHPLLMEGNHSMDLTASGLEADYSYKLEIDLYTWERMAGEDDAGNLEYLYFNGSSTTTQFYFETTNYTCNAWVSAQLVSGTWDSSGNFQWNDSVESPEFKFDGPCEIPPSPFTLTMDGVEHEPIQHYDEYDECEEDGNDFECWQSDWDFDGDGEPDWTEHRHDCMEDTASGTWLCEGWEEYPFVGYGNHSMELAVDDLETGESYMLSWTSHHGTQFGTDDDSGEVMFNATTSTWTEQWFLETDNYTCSVNYQFDLNMLDWYAPESYHSYDVYHENLGYNGPCEQPPSPFTLTYDGTEWEQTWNYEEFDECVDDDMGEGGFECWQSDWDNDGDGEPDWTEHHFDCDEDSTNGTWWCPTHHTNPFISEGNHTMELSTDDLEVGQSYQLGVSVNYGSQGGSDYEELSFEFNATAETMSETFHMETDNYTCSVNIYVTLEESWNDSSGNSGWNWLVNDYFHFQGPCEKPPSPFTLTADGVEWEQTQHYNEYDECEEDGNGFECWQSDWDFDGDGEPDWIDLRDNCMEDAANGTWLCESWASDPSIDEGNHTMEITVEDLEVGTNYSLEISMEVCQNMGGCDYEETYFEFNATSETMSETFHMETDNYTCHVVLHVNLFGGNEEGWMDGNYEEHFGYNGPCEQPPSPFTLTTDGVEWEQTWNYEEFDECEEDGNGFECWNDDWDYDGDGEPDHSNWYDVCMEDSDGNWECQTWAQDPEIDEGNHTMEITVEDLEVGTNYSLGVSIDICQSMAGCDYEETYFDFNATSETMSETFQVETDNYTCNVNLRVDLHEMTEDGSKYVAGDWFSYHGPCEQPPSPFTLIYDGQEYVKEGVMLDFDNCDQDMKDLSCWQDEWDWDDDGVSDYSMWMDEDACVMWVADPSGETGWECESPWFVEPEIAGGNHTMELTVEDLDVGENYSVEISTVICSDMEGCDWDSFEFEFDATAETMSETFYVEIDDSTCRVNLEVGLSNLTEDGWNDRLFYDWFGFNGPCEQSADGIVLGYDNGSGPVEWEMEEIERLYDHCWANGPDDWVCMNEGNQYINWENGCDEVTQDGDWNCPYWDQPRIEEAADLGMTWTLVDLEVGDNYTILWQYCTYELMGDRECSDEGQEIPDHANITATSGENSVDWELVIENATCHVEIEWWLVYWGDEAIDFEDGDPDDGGEGRMDFQGPCQWEWPVDVSLEVDDNGWQEIEGIDFMELMEMEEDSEDGPDDNGDDDDFMELIMDNHYQLSEGNWSMSWTLDGLEEDEAYMLSWEYEGPSGQSFFCGNGEEIPFDWVNDDEEDCEDGADEQQYDDNGDPINWFDCNDGSEVWIYQVNDGYDDCPDGEDEGGFVGDGGEEMINATSSSETFEWELEVPSDMCIMMINAEVFDEEYNPVGWFLAFIAGDLWADDDGDNWPDCLPREGDGDHGGWEMEDFEIGHNHEAILEIVDDASGTAAVWVARHTTLDDDIRMKIDHDFFDGDGVLNDTEAMEFEQMWAYGSIDSDGCDEEAPAFTMNGVGAWCAEPHASFYNLANNTDGNAPVMVGGWILHYNVTVDESGEMTLYFPGDVSGETITFNGTLCGGAHDGAGLVPVSWSYNDIAVTSPCVDVMAGDAIQSIEIIFGAPDTDGDGYNDFDDRFPDDPEEWADTDDDGVGDNSDEFPNDATETNDADGDGVGDNGDAFPWDPTESADSDGDGWGDNSDAFPDDGNEWVDTDGDGVGDNADTDADGDGTDDTDEDSDGDGVNDDQDDFPFDANETSDSDGDGVGDNGDDFPNDANETTDTDGDGVGDNEDEDADGDGTPNDLDDFPLNNGESTDTDGDGVGDTEDDFPNDPSEYIDSDGDGTGDNADTDDDNDGTPDTSDAFPLDANETTDTDGDGYGDASDAFPNDAGEWSDYDGDGFGDNSDAFMSDPYENRDSDGDGTGDNADWAPNDPNEKLDSDGDGVGNNADAFPTNPEETSDQDGDGIGDNADTDADGDGIPDDSVDPVEEPDSGGILPGFTAVTGLASVLGAAILVAGRRKD